MMIMFQISKSRGLKVLQNKECSMREATVEEYLEFMARNRRIVIEDREILLEPIDVKRFELLSEELTDVSTTV
jgi:hypothetical protein